MSFIVDGGSWDFNRLDADEITNLLQAFLKFLLVSQKRNEDVYIGDDFQSREMFKSASFWAVFGRGGIFPLDPNDLQVLTAWLLRARYYVDELAWPTTMSDFEVAIGDDPTNENADVAWVHHSVRAGNSLACLCLTREGLLSTSSLSGGTVDVHFVNHDPERRVFWRQTILNLGGRSEDLQRLASHAYPDVFFAKGAIEGVKGLAGGFNAHRAAVLKIFAVLDDVGSWIFNAPAPAIKQSESNASANSTAPPDKLIEARFRVYALEIAPEHASVRLNSDTREAREVVIEVVKDGQKVAKTFYCEWHFKLEKHQNRIHIHAPDEHTDGRIIVAKIDKHLL